MTLGHFVPLLPVVLLTYSLATLMKKSDFRVIQRAVGSSKGSFQIEFSLDANHPHPTTSQKCEAVSSRARTEGS